MLGVQISVKWEGRGDSVAVGIPTEIAEHKPSKQAYAFKLQVEHG
jgi:hypothetical protein